MLNQNAFAPNLEDLNIGFQVEEFNIKIKQNTLTLILGQTGSGKSSLLQSLFGEMSRTRKQKFPQGTRPMADIFIPEKISYLAQRPMILSCTIQENIILERELDQERMQWALKCADLLEDMNNSNNGLMTMVGEAGATLSGGQRTRVALARNLYRGGDIYLFDDPLSALDINVGS